MKFKNFPNWLKGGIIASLIQVVLLLIMGIIVLLGWIGVIQDPVWGLLILPPIIIAFFPGMLLLFAGIESKFLQIIVSIILYFLIGSLLGWMVSRVRLKKQNHLKRKINKKMKKSHARK